MLRKSLKDIGDFASKAGETTLSAASRATSGVSQTASDAAEMVSGVAGGAANAVGDVVDATTKTIADTATSVAMHSENAVSSAFNGAKDTVDATVATAKGVGQGVANVLPVAYYGGIAISMVVAPVPTLIGVVALEVMCAAFQDGLSKETGKAKRASDQRDIEQKIGMLERYGKLPQNSIVENELVRLEIDTVEKTTTGVIKMGKFKGRALESLSESELRYIHGDVSHELTKRMIAAYIGCRFPDIQL